MPCSDGLKGKWAFVSGFAWRDLGRFKIYLNADANLFLSLVLLDLGLPSSSGIGDGGGVLPV
jgi:hypothetical protein